MNDDGLARYLHAFIQETEAALAGKRIRLPGEGAIVFPPAPCRAAVETENNERRLFTSFPEAFAAQGSFVFLTGASGAGKTTALLQLALDTAQRCLESLASSTEGLSPVPIFRNARAWVVNDPLVPWAQENVREQYPQIPLNQYPLLYLFDGLEELGGRRPVNPAIPGGNSYDPRLQFLRAAEQIPHAKVVISCREQDATELYKKSFPKGMLTLQPLEHEAVQQFLHGTNQSALWESLTTREALLEFARTPLLLALLSAAVGTGGTAASLPENLPSAKAICDFYIHQRFVQAAAAQKALPFNEQTTRALLTKIGVALCKKRRGTATVLTKEEVHTLLGKRAAEFISFACAMQFLWQYAPDSPVQFIHRHLRDCCALPGLLGHPSGEAQNLVASLLMRWGLAGTMNRPAALSHSAVEALGEIRDPVAIPALSATVRGEDAPWSAADALVNIGAASIPALIELLQEGSRHVPGCAAYALRKIGSASVPSLIAVAQTGSVTARKRAVDTLGNIGDTRAVPVLIQALKDTQEDTRLSAIRALAKIGDPSVLPALMEKLRDAQERVRRDAVDAVGKIGDISAIPALTESLQDKSEYVRLRAVRMLAKISGADIDIAPALITALQDENRFVRRSALSILVKRKDTAAVPALLPLLKDKDNDVRRDALYALGMMGGESAVPYLKEAIQDTESGVRFMAETMLERILKTSLPPEPEVV